MTIQLNAKMIQGEHCLLYHLLNDSELNHFHVSMIATQPNLPAIPMACHIFEGQSALLFMPKESLNMKLWLTDTTNTASHFIQLIQDTVENLLILSDHHLNLNNIYLDSEYCFINPYTQSPLFIYMPLRTDLFDNKIAFKNLLFEWIQHFEQPLNTHQQHYMLQLMLFLSKEQMTLKSLLMGLRELKNHANSENAHQKSSMISTPDVNHMNESNRHTTFENSNTEEKKSSQHSEKAIFNIKSWWQGILSRRNEKRFSEKSTDDIKKGINKFKFNSNLYSKSSVVSVNHEKLFDETNNKSDTILTDLSEPIIREWDYADSQGVLKQVVIEQTSFETVLLSKKNGVVEPKVLLRHSGNTEVFFIKNNKLSIGRNPAVNDIVIEDPIIGRIHAELHVHHDKIYVKDLNSLNGTWLNQTKIMANQFVEVKVGECIKVGKGELILL